MILELVISVVRYEEIVLVSIGADEVKSKTKQKRESEERREGSTA